MPSYILKTFDNSGHLTGRTEFRAADDAEAQRTMDYMRGDRVCELWNRTQLVKAHRANGR